MVKNPPANAEAQETWVQFLGQKEALGEGMMQEIESSIPGWGKPLEKEMATRSSIFAWRIPWTEEPGGYGPWGNKGLDMSETT